MKPKQIKKLLMDEIRVLSFWTKNGRKQVKTRKEILNRNC